MALGQRADPYLAFNFLVEIDGLLVGGFSEVSGLQCETVVETYREGGVNAYERKFVGPTRYPANLILKHGLTDRDTLWQWYQDVRQGRITRQTVSIVLLDDLGVEKWRWVFTQAFPVRWAGPDLRGLGAEVAVETLELVHCGLDDSLTGKR